MRIEKDLVIRKMRMISMVKMEKRVCGDSVEDTRYQRVFMDENLPMLDGNVGLLH